MDKIRTITLPSLSKTITHDQIIIVSLIIVPLILTGPQLLVGSVVNFLLILLATTCHRKNWLIIAALPSLMAIIHGAVLGVFTPYLFYLWPIITIGNWIYMTLSQKNIVFAIITKTLILFTGATILFQLKIIPSVLLNSLGMIQLITALIGGFGAKIWTKNKVY